MFFRFRIGYELVAVLCCICNQYLFRLSNNVCVYFSKMMIVFFIKLPLPL